MSRTTKRNTTNLYKRCTPVQLLSVARQWQKKLAIVNRMSPSATFKGKTVAHQRKVIKGELDKIANVTKTQTVQLINTKIKTLRRQMANRLGVKFSSPKAASSAVKRLTIKARQIKGTRQPWTVITLCAKMKLSAYKNPVVRSARKTTTRKTQRRRTTSRTRSRRTAVGAQNRAHKNLKKTVRTLKRRNSFMRKLVNRFRRRIAQLQRNYRTAQARRARLRVVHRGPSNVVRFRRPATSTYARQRRASY